MPLSKMKKVLEYSTYNKLFFLLIFLFFAIFDYTLELFFDQVSIVSFLVLLTITLILFGYGMLITRDRINNGVRLPKIMIKDIFVLGIKSYIVFSVYLFVQGVVVGGICSPLHFPDFELEDMILDLPHTLHLLGSHNIAEVLVFILVGGILFYVTSFFMEIAMARLADTGSIISAFNLLGIKEDIDAYGWWDYIKEYTVIVLVIVIFAALKFIVIPVYILDLFWDVLFDLLIFVTYFLGIGDIYRRVKQALDT